MDPGASVFVVDDEPEVQLLVAALLESVGTTQAVGYPSAEEFLQQFHPDQPGCLVLDVRLPGMSGLQLQGELSDRGARLPIIMLSGHGDIPMAVHAVQSGAMDFLEKPVRGQLLLERIRAALVRDAFNRRRRAAQETVLEVFTQLTEREREVLDFVLQGKANKQIAGDLEVTVKAVENHRSRIMKKLKVHSVAELFTLRCMAGLCPHAAHSAYSEGKPWPGSLPFPN